LYPLHSSEQPFSGHLQTLLRTSPNDAALLGSVDALAMEHGKAVYAEMMLLLTGKYFEEDLARSHWYAAVNHAERIFHPEYIATGFRPALLDYLHNVAGEFAEPRLIEADYLQNITRSSVTDGLTGLYNQTYFKKVLEKRTTTQRRSNDLSFALLLFDLDHFKQYNDRCGHLAGDEALRQCADIIASTLRDGDVAARYGGEEFAVMLQDVDRHGAFVVGERIRKEIEKYHFLDQEALDSRNLTVSGGVAIFPDSGRTVADLINAADKELYKAKEWRNCIYSFSGEKRRRSRKQVKSLVEYASFDGTLYRPALSYDISEEGIGIGCDTVMLEGMMLMLRLTKPYWPENVQLTATVRQVRQKNDMVCVGLEFKNSLEAVKILMSNLGMTSALQHAA
jgi:diguanylate cyclase (GGDEF)-like protein